MFIGLPSVVGRAPLAVGSVLAILKIGNYERNSSSEDKQKKILSVVALKM